jgi:uncharacterized protein DUF3631
VSGERRRRHLDSIGWSFKDLVAYASRSAWVRTADVLGVGEPAGAAASRTCGARVERPPSIPRGRRGHHETGIGDELESVVPGARPVPIARAARARVRVRSRPESQPSPSPEGVLELVCAKPELIVGITPAVTFRLIERDCPTLLLDEIDNMLQDGAAKGELVGILNAGYRRGMSVHRCGGPSKTDLETFAVFCPKAFAGLRQLPSAALASRCLRIEVVRRRAGEPGGDFIREDELSQSEPLRERLGAWVGSISDSLPKRPARITGLRDRTQEAVRLAAIAAVAGGSWPQRLERAIRAIVNDTPVEDLSHGVGLLADIKGFFDQHPTDAVRTAELLEHLNRIEESPWADWNGRPLTGQTLAKLLKPYKIKPGPIWTFRANGNKGSAKGYARQQFEDVWSRLLPPVQGISGEAGENPHHNRDRPREHDGEAAPALTPAATTANPHEHGDLTYLTDEEVIRRAKEDGTDCSTHRRRCAPA